MSSMKMMMTLGRGAAARSEEQVARSKRSVRMRGLGERSEEQGAGSKGRVRMMGLEK
jgi:hypothetical protein